MGNITLTCTGGMIGATVTPSVSISLTTNITNRLDLNGNPLGITATVNAAPIAVSASLLSPQI